MYPDYYRDMERTNGYMYYPGGNSLNTSGTSNTPGTNMNGMNRTGTTSYYT